MSIILKFAADTNEAVFLFDESIAAYLDELFKRALRLHTVELMRKRASSDPDLAKDFPALVNEEVGLAEYFIEQPQRIRALFTPFLRLA